MWKLYLVLILSIPILMQAENRPEIRFVPQHSVTMRQVACFIDPEKMSFYAQAAHTHETVPEALDFLDAMLQTGQAFRLPKLTVVQVIDAAEAAPPVQETTVTGRDWLGRPITQTTSLPNPDISPLRRVQVLGQPISCWLSSWGLGTEYLDIQTNKRYAVDRMHSLRKEKDLKHALPLAD